MSDKAVERNNIISTNNQFEALNQQEQVEKKENMLMLLINVHKGR